MGNVNIDDSPSAGLVGGIFISRKQERRKYYESSMC